MSRSRLPTILALGLLLGGTGCSNRDKYDLILEYDFQYNDRDWVGGFADYPVDTTGAGYDLAWGHESLPANLGTGGGLYVSGHNHSDDLFMYIKYRVTGLLVYVTYRVRFEVQVATDAPSGCAGIGGSPGEAVYMKAGATTVEPGAIPEEDGLYRMNIDKGNQAVGGEDALMLGHIGNSNYDCLNTVYEIKSFDSQSQTFEFTTGAAGAVWLLVGTDSGFEGRTSLYYTSVRVSLASKS